MISQELNEILKKSKDKISILIQELNTKKEIYNLDANKRVKSASIIKIPIMLSVLDKLLKNKNLNLNTKIEIDKNLITNDSEVFDYERNECSIEELITWMIINSDNSATNILIDFIGMDYINNYIVKKLKLKNTILQRKMLDKKLITKKIDNYTSSRDMYLLFEKLFNYEILSKTYCDFAIKTLFNQRKKDQLLRYIYKPIKFAHKTGGLDYLNHDVGVLKEKGKLIFISVLVYESESKSGNRKLTGLIGKKIYDHLNNYSEISIKKNKI